MQFILLIHGDDAALDTMPPEDAASVMAAMDRFDAEISEAGQKLGSLRLQPSATATTLRVREGNTLLTDGPFAETKDQLGGLYVIEVNDLDEALTVAARMPIATFCTIEVRPVMRIDIRRAVSAA